LCETYNGDLSLSLFEKAIEVLETSGAKVGTPISFLEYQSAQASSRRTADVISVDELQRLSPDLKESGYMVFRLGKPEEGKGTQFVLAKSDAVFSEYFLDDGSVFGGLAEELFLPNTHSRYLFPYQLMPRLTETSLVNLACASGLLSVALGLDDPDWRPIPATGQSTFTFEFTPRADIGKRLVHRDGQVELDAVFVGRRRGLETLFVIEAKSSKNMRSLAKHKLVYPCLALHTEIPQNMPIVPVYLRCVPRQDKILFYVAECNLPDPRISKLTAIDTLVVGQASCFSLHGFGN
jgi:hypothetical protein